MLVLPNFLKQRSDRKIFSLWQEKHRLHQARHILILSISIMTLMVFFDHFFVQENPEPYYLPRLIALSILFPLLFLQRKSLQDQRKTWFSQAWERILLLSGPTIFHFLYLYYLYYLDTPQNHVYYTGLLLVIFYSSFVLHRFRWEQNFFNVFFALFSFAMAISTKHRADESLIVSICHLNNIIMLKYFRNDFRNTLRSHFSLLNMMMPTKFAEAAVVSLDEIKLQDLFKTRPRFTVCLCSDWRNFQNLSETKNISELSEMLESYYDLVQEHLQKHIPSNNYYFNWSADELIIIFFNDEENRESALQDGLNFAEILSSEIFSLVHQKFSGEVRYDIGLSSGVGLLGLQGPKNMKKTTITGEVGGLAKRFQEEAKLIRTVQFPEAPPLVVMDETLFRFAQDKKKMTQRKFEPVIGTVKNIFGKKCYLWKPEVRPEALSDPPSKALKKSA